MLLAPPTPRPALPVPYLCAGDGPAVLLLHGCPGSMFSWRSNLSRLAQGHRVFALDLNHLSVAQGAHDLESYAHATHRFMIRAGIRDALVVGHSMGAGVAIHLAAAAPERVRGLALLGSLGLSPHLILMLCRLPGVADLMGAIGPRLPRGLQRLMSRHFHGILYNGEGPKASPEAQREQQDLVAPGALLATLHTARAANLTALRAACALVRAPTLLLHGSRDRLVSLKKARELQSHLRGSRLAILEGAGHMLHIERADEINARLLAFSP